MDRLSGVVFLSFGYGWVPFSELSGAVRTDEGVLLTFDSPEAAWRYVDVVNGHTTGYGRAE